MAEIRKLQRSQLDFNNVMEIAQDAIMSRINCHNIGRILEFDKDTQTCMVELMQIKQFNNQLITPAPITQVPLIILGAGGGHITMPDPVGTICLLLFLDRNMDNFMETGEQYVPDTTRMHDFTDCVALTTFTTLAAPLENYDDEAISIFNEGLIEDVKKISYIKIYPNIIQIHTNDGAEIALDDKVKISNTSRNLATLIQNFLVACESIAVSNGVLTAASKQKFTTLKSQFQELLK